MILHHSVLYLYAILHMLSIEVCEFKRTYIGKNIIYKKIYRINQTTPSESAALTLPLTRRQCFVFIQLNTKYFSWVATPVPAQQCHLYTTRYVTPLENPEVSTLYTKIPQCSHYCMLSSTLCGDCKCIELCDNRNMPFICDCTQDSRKIYKSCNDALNSNGILIGLFLLNASSATFHVMCQHMKIGEEFCNWRSYDCEAPTWIKKVAANKESCIETCKDISKSKQEVNCISFQRGSINCHCEQNSIVLVSVYAIYDSCMLVESEEENAWAVILHLQNHTIFENQYDQYKLEIGNVFDRNYWIGLQNLYELTRNGDFVLRLSYEKEDTREKVVVEYLKFKIYENLTYKMNYSEMRRKRTGVLYEDQMQYNIHSPFSTKSYGTWWGPVESTETPFSSSGIFWGADKASNLEIILRRYKRCEVIIGEYNQGTVSTKNGQIMGKLHTYTGVRHFTMDIDKNVADDRCTGTLVYPDKNEVFTFIYIESVCSLDFNSSRYIWKKLQCENPPIIEKYPTDGVERVGCFKDAASPRVFTDAVTFTELKDKPLQMLKECRDYVKSLSMEHVYFGIQVRNECHFGGIDYARKGEGTDCNYYTGLAYHNVVYKLI